ncbi:hypothetical protein [Xanthobacter versatilis]|uniref:hypothetical protein n=1 Tax=Xanthobacter autotrophicus (strain ATCC BAA-1158 / Py2) TaxID=78245 RepID=UPI00372B8DD0
MSMITDNRAPLFAESVRVFACDFDAASKVAHSISSILGLEDDDAIKTGRIATLALCAGKMRQDGLSPDVIMATVAAALDCEEADAWINGTCRLLSPLAASEFERAKTVWRRNAGNGIDRRTRAERNNDEYADVQAAYQARHAGDNIVAFTPRSVGGDYEDEFDEGA